jgi:hypothetical protein
MTVKHKKKQQNGVFGHITINVKSHKKKGLFGGKILNSKKKGKGLFGGKSVKC